LSLEERRPPGTSAVQSIQLEGGTIGEVYMQHIRISTHRMTMALVLVVLPLTALACFITSKLLPANGPAASAVSTPTPAPIPDGWKLSKDASGACQVATPPDWQLGKDFFLAADKPDPGPFAGTPGAYPPMGEALWKDNPGLQGHYFQTRRTLMGGELICSVWRIQADTAFTDEQERELDEVGKTLQEVQ
jgi:hypothetical protein